ncbi:phage capsid protein [Serratia marcescens]|nr:phage capsid protein [Serratia marcescens]
MAKKVTKFFRIGVEGDTVDGREIGAADIQQMAATYSPKVYGARINMEHIKGILPDGYFRRYGGVVELKAEKIDEPDEPLLHGKWALYASLAPTADLVSMVGAGQKVFTSMEIRRDFAKTGKSYLVGLAVTDDPASLGTDMLEFSRRHENVEFSAPLEVHFDFEPVADPETSFSARIKAMFSRKQATDDVRFDEMEGAVMTVAEQLQEADTRFTEKFAALSKQVADLKQQVKTGSDAFSALQAQLSTSEDFSQQARPEATGGNSAQDVLTDC